MRKLTVAMLLVLAGTVCAIAQEQEVTYKVGIDSESIAEAAEVLEKYVDGPLGRYYAAAVRRQVIIGRGEVVVLPIGIIVALVSMVTGAKAITEGDGNDADVAMLMLGCAALIVAIGLLVGDGLPRYATPEFYATRDILQSLH